ncbi:hypothetical protein [Mycolicibacillus koreensis]|nr:hypothetical protein [Mycolicibacillus koreensis]
MSDQKEQPANYARGIRMFTLGMLGVLMIATVVMFFASQITPH